VWSPLAAEPDSGSAIALLSGNLTEASLLVPGVHLFLSDLHGGGAVNLLIEMTADKSPMGN
jgi:hypothetical protein